LGTVRRWRRVLWAGPRNMVKGSVCESRNIAPRYPLLYSTRAPSASALTRLRGADSYDIIYI
jgi:hypothetical protein